MSPRRTLLGALAALLCMAPGAAAQEPAPDVYQQLFAFVGTSLTVEVVSPQAGELHVLRGGPGQIRVRGATPGGFAGAGLNGEENRLTITAAGADRARYLLVVPDETFLRIRLPGETVARTFGGEQDDGLFVWGTVAPSDPPRPPAPPRR